MVMEYREIEGRYIDSVLLMQITRELEKEKGVSKAAVMAASRANLEVLKNLGFEPPPGVKGASILIAIEADSHVLAKSSIDKALELMDKGVQTAPQAELYLDELRNSVKPGELAVVFVSTAGEYAKDIALKALDQGAYVHIFSSNVSIEDELLLKKKAHEKGLLVMGPDAGTAILMGKGLGFANAVREGGIGIVGSSGTGIQELTVLLDKGGVGVSAAIGVGSNDLTASVQGIMTKDAIAMLRDSRYLIVIAKKPDADVKRLIIEMIKDVPSAFISLGDNETRTVGKTYVTGYIDDAVNHALQHCGRSQLMTTKKPAIPKPKDRKLLRGFFVGGSLCYQAQAILAKNSLKVFSNAPANKSLQLPKDWKDVSVCIDTGAEEYVQGRPHPMIDPKARNAMIVEESKRPDVAVILLDVVLGYGSADDVLEGLEGISKGPVLVASVCGTPKDKQNSDTVKAGLEKMGMTVFDSSGQAAAYAGELMKGAGS